MDQFVNTIIDKTTANGTELYQVLTLRFVG